MLPAPSEPPGEIVVLHVVHRIQSSLHDRRSRRSARLAMRGGWLAGPMVAPSLEGVPTPPTRPGSSADASGAGSLHAAGDGGAGPGRPRASGIVKNETQKRPGRRVFRTEAIAASTDRSGSSPEGARNPLPGCPRHSHRSSRRPRPQQGRYKGRRSGGDKIFAWQSWMERTVEMTAGAGKKHIEAAVTDETPPPILPRKGEEPGAIGPS